MSKFISSIFDFVSKESKMPQLMVGVTLTKEVVVASFKVAISKVGKDLPIILFPGTQRTKWLLLSLKAHVAPSVEDSIRKNV